jgi:CobQ-like glutamine amidotransferase family enzyme
VKGFGNDAASGREGAVYHNVFGSYLHGPLLSKNPSFADMLLLRALHRKFGLTLLQPLDDEFATSARRAIVRRVLGRAALGAV